MRMLPYEVVDVFTDVPFAGNPLAVVFDTEGLPTEALQAIAREFHLSETAFPLPSGRADYRVRIFTPESELPFAGHPSIGTAHTLARLGRLQPGERLQECGAGLLPIRVGTDAVTLSGGAPVVGDPVDPMPALSALGLTADDLAADAPPPRLAGCGISFLYLLVRPDALDRVAPDMTRLARLDIGTGVSLSTWDSGSRTARTRVFAPDVGEDPATGSAALGFGVWLVASGVFGADGTTGYTVRQGVEMQRPSTLDGTVTAAAGRVVETTVTGRVVPVARGEIRRP